MLKILTLITAAKSAASPLFSTPYTHHGGVRGAYRPAGRSGQRAGIAC